MDNFHRSFSCFHTEPLEAFSILLINEELDSLDAALPEPSYHLCARWENIISDKKRLYHADV